LGRVHERTHTPHIAIATLLAILLPLAFFGSIGHLASATVLMLLVVFAVVNGALFILKGRPSEPRGKFEVPRWVPALGTAVCVVLAIVRVSSGDWRAPALAGTLLIGIVAVYAMMRPKAVEPLDGSTFSEPSAQA
jgi:APA family basic amino acid/polyamine antiporter